MRCRILFAALVAAAMSQSCSRHTSESAQNTASLRSTSVQRITVADSLRLSHDYIMLIDSPSLRVVRTDGTSPQTVTLSGRRAVIASRTEALATGQSKISVTDSLAADTTQTKTEVRESRQRWWMPLLALVVAAFMLRLSLRGIGSRR